MEQYYFSSSVYYRNVRKALNNFRAKRIFIRWVGSLGGKTVICENLDGKTLDIKKVKSGLSIIIDGAQRFLYEFSRDKVWGRSFAIEYFRGKEICLPMGINPNNETLPLVRESILRGSNRTHLMEITFKGKIPLRIYSPSENLWEIDV